MPFEGSASVGEPRWRSFAPPGRGSRVARCALVAILICGLASSCSSDESDKRSRTADTTTAESAASPRKHVSYMMPIGELDGWIVLSAATPTREGEELRSSLVAWDPVDAKLVTLVGDQPEAQQFSIAWEVLAESL